MSEQCEIFSALRAVRSAKKLSNKQKSLDILGKHNIKYVTNNNGVHCVVENHIDYWPSTGLFKNRKTGKSGRGVFNLIKTIQKESE